MVKVLYVGDSRKMKGGVSSVIKTIESTYLWKKYHCHWIECQINASAYRKLFYMIVGTLKGMCFIPFYNIVHFHTGLGNSMWVQMPMFVWSIIWRKKRVIHIHVGNQIVEQGVNTPLAFACKHANHILTLGKCWIPYIPHRPNTPVTHLYNPAPNKRKILPPKKYFLFAAYITANKGYAHLLKACKQVFEVYPEWKLVICGVGEEKAVTQLITELNLSDNVELLGWIEGNQKKRIFQEAWSYCMTSQMEGFPMSVLEAIAYGVPVISTKVGCLPELFTSEKDILFYDFGDTNELASLLLRIIEQRELRSKLREGATEIHKALLSIPVFSWNLDRIYKTLTFS